MDSWRTAVIAAAAGKAGAAVIASNDATRPLPSGER
jgi:hypothetical protein